MMSASDRNADRTDAVLLALADEHRRAVLSALKRTDGAELDETELVEQVTHRVAALDGSADENREQTRILLHHIHLPKLADAGLIVHDRDGGRVAAVTEELPDDALLTVR